MVQRLEWILAIPVETPLSHIAVHVVKSPGVGLQSTHRMGLPIGIDLIPGHRIDRSMEHLGFAGATGVLPLSLCGQVPAPTGGDERRSVVEIGQSPSKLPSLLPTDLFHGPIPAPERTGIVGHEQRPLRLRARCLRKEKPVRQGDAMQPLIRLAIRFVD